MPARISHFSSCLVTGALAALAGCDFPTALPRWDTRWLMALDSTRISVAALLPSGVTVTADGSAFQLDLPAVTLRRTLRQMCGDPCVAAAGSTVPKPAFTTSFGTQIDLPADVASATLIAGQLQVRLSHDLAFDPIRPSATARGYILMTATSGGRVVARDSIPGQTVAFGPGVVLQRTAQILPGPIAPPIQVTVTVFSPAGDPVRVNPDQAITIVFTPQQARVSQASIRVANRTVNASQVEVDLQELDDGIVDQVRDGALRVEVTNPFQITGTLLVTISWPGGTLQKSVAIAPGFTEYRIPLSAAEIQSFLRQPSVLVAISGVVTAQGATLSVVPGQVMAINPMLELTIGEVE